VVVVGLCMFIPGARIARYKSIALAALGVTVMTFTAVGMIMAPAPPSATAMAGSSLGVLAVVGALAYWFGAFPRQA
jgi:hypothetical protein